MRFIRSFELSDWCLKVIAENLLLFIHSKTIPQKHIDFLLRLYAKHIYQEYCSLNTISEDCIVWFLNPHSKQITLSVTTDKVLKQLQVVGTNITSLSLKLSLASENILNSIICCVPHLEYLDLSSSCCTNKTLFLLQRMCPGLSTLNLNECKYVSNQGMINLCDSGHLALKYLDIIDTEVEYDGLRYILTGMPSLKCLKFDNLGDAFCFAHEYEYVTDTYKNIRYNLTELIYEGTELCDNPVTVILMWTIMCPKVEKVHFLCPVNEEVLYTCTKFQHLKEIKIKPLFNLNCMRMKDVITPLLPSANSLKTLILPSSRISILTLLKNFTNLECLYLDNVQFTDFKEEDTQITQTKLDTLIIKHNNFMSYSTTYKAIAFLISVSKNVTRLRFSGVKVMPRDMFLIILKSMKRLTFVDFSYCPVRTIKHFFKIPTMRQIYLDLCNSAFSFDQCSALKNIPAQNSPCTLSWRIMIDNPDDSDSDIL